MAEPSIDIDRVVREVLAELRAPPGAAAPAATSPASTSPDTGASPQAEAKKPAANSGGELVVNSRVVTMAELGDRLDGAQLDGARWLVVPPGAVVTPSVRDALRQKNVTLTFAGPEAERATDGLRLVLITAVTRFDPAALVGALRNEAVRVEAQASNCLIRTADQFAGELRKADTLGALLTSHPAAAFCLANRQPGVRAVSGGDAAEVARAATEVGANLLVIDPAERNLFQLKQMVVEFCRLGVRQCPELLRERLG